MMVHFNSCCYRQWRREGGGYRHSAPGPGPVVGGPGQAGVFVLFLIGSQWGLQDFDKGGGPPKTDFGLASSTLGMI